MAAIAGTPLHACHRPCPNVASSLTESSKERDVSHVFAAHTSGEKLSNFAGSRQNSEAKSINNGICFFCSIFKFSPDRAFRNLNRFIVLQSHRTILLYDSVEATRSSFRRHIRQAQRHNGTLQPCSSLPSSREGLPRDYFIICLRDTSRLAKSLFSGSQQLTIGESSSEK